MRFGPRQGREAGNQGNEAEATHLLMSEAQLVLEDRLAIGQELHLVGQSVEGVGQRMAELKAVHSHGEGDGQEGGGGREGGRERRRWLALPTGRADRLDGAELSPAAPRLGQ